MCSCDLRLFSLLCRLMNWRVNWRSSLKERVMPRGTSNGENKDNVYIVVPCADEIQLQ